MGEVVQYVHVPHTMNGYIYARTGGWGDGTMCLVYSVNPCVRQA